MKISSAQMMVLSQHTTAGFVRQCAASLRDRFPEATRGLSESQLTADASMMVERLRAIGFDCTGDLERGVHLTYAIQKTARPRAIPEDLLALMTDPHTTIDKKIDVLEQLLIFDDA